jgi:hypothetical protein
MKISDMIEQLQAVLAKHGDIKVYIPTDYGYGGRTGELDIDVMVLDGSSTEPDYSQPKDHPEGFYLYIAGQI